MAGQRNFGTFLWRRKLDEFWTRACENALSFKGLRQAERAKTCEFWSTQSRFSKVFQKSNCSTSGSVVSSTGRTQRGLRNFLEKTTESRIAEADAHVT